MAAANIVALLAQIRAAMPRCARRWLHAWNIRVSPALIHNHYPEVANRIRGLQGRSARVERDTIRSELLQERKRSRELRASIKEQDLRIRKLTSINERL